MNDIQKQIDQLKIELKLLLGTRRELAIAMGAMTLVFLIGYFLTYAEYDKISLNQVRNEETQAKIDDAMSRKKAWDTALKSPEYQASSELVNSVLPSTKPVLGDIYAFNQLASTHPVTITKFSFAPGELATSGATLASKAVRSGSKKTGTDNYLLLDLSMVGSYAEVLRALADMEKMIPIGNIFSAAISKSPTGSASVKIAFLSYYYDQQNSVGKSSELPKLVVEDRTNLASMSAYAKSTNENSGQIGVTGGGKTNVFDVIQKETTGAESILLETQIKTDANGDQFNSLPEQVIPNN